MKNTLRIAGFLALFVAIGVCSLIPAGSTKGGSTTTGGSSTVGK